MADKYTPEQLAEYEAAAFAAETPPPVETDTTEYEAAVAEEDAPKDGWRKPGGLESFGRGTAQGLTGGLSDEAGGAGTAVLQGITNLMPQSLRERLDLVEAPASDAYAFSRDEERAANEAARREHGTLYGAGEGVGGALLAAGTGGAGAVLAKTGAKVAGKELAKRLAGKLSQKAIERLAMGAGAAVGGAVGGGVSAFGHAEEDVASETAKGAGMGALTSAVPGLGPALAAHTIVTGDEADKVEAATSLLLGQAARRRGEGRAKKAEEARTTKEANIKIVQDEKRPKLRELDIEDRKVDEVQAAVRLQKFAALEERLKSEAEAAEAKFDALVPKGQVEAKAATARKHRREAEPVLAREAREGAEAKRSSEIEVAKAKAEAAKAEYEEVALRRKQQSLVDEFNKREAAAQSTFKSEAVASGRQEAARRAAAAKSEKAQAELNAKIAAIDAEIADIPNRVKSRFGPDGSPPPVDVPATPEAAKAAREDALRQARADFAADLSAALERKRAGLSAKASEARPVEPVITDPRSLADREALLRRARELGLKVPETAAELDPAGVYPLAGDRPVAPEPGAPREAAKVKRLLDIVESLKARQAPVGPVPMPPPLDSEVVATAREAGRVTPDELNLAGRSPQVAEEPRLSGLMHETRKAEASRDAARARREDPLYKRGEMEREMGPQVARDREAKALTDLKRQGIKQTITPEAILERGRTELESVPKRPGLELSDISLGSPLRSAARIGGKLLAPDLRAQLESPAARAAFNDELMGRLQSKTMGLSNEQLAQAGRLLNAFETGQIGVPELDRAAQSVPWLNDVIEWYTRKEATDGSVRLGANK